MRLHGTQQKYSAGCRCEPCRKAWSRYNSERKRARKNGDWRGSVSLERARSHILKLGNIGAVARLSGVHRMTISRIVNRRVPGIYKETEAAILAVTLEEVKTLWPLIAEPPNFVAVEPVRKMIADLRASGFSDCALGRKASLKSNLRVRGKRFIRAYNARRIEQIYRKSGVAA